MPKSFRSPLPLSAPRLAFRPIRGAHPFHLGLTAAALALSAWAGLAGCQPVDIDAPASDTVSNVTDSATLRVSNNIEQDPQTITLVLFAGNAVDITNATRVRTLGSVAYGTNNKTLRVPAGTWKLAYEDGSGVLVPLTDERDGAQEWLKAIFAKDGDYSLILASDGNRTVWIPTFTTDPNLQ